MKRLLLLWALINAILFISLAFVSRSQWVDISALGSGSQETQAIEQELVRLKQQLALLEAANYAAADELSALQAKFAAASAPQPSPVEIQEQRDRILRQTPEYRHHYHLDLRRWVQMHYGDFLARQTLTPEQITRFKELRVELIASINDAAEIAVDQGLDADSTLARAAVERTGDTIQKEIRDLLGEKAFEDYQRSSSLPEPTLRNFQLTLADQSLPQLSVEQAKVVAAAYQKANGYNWDKQTLEHVSRHLSPEQFKALNDYNETSQAAGEWDAKIQNQIRASLDKTSAD